MFKQFAILASLIALLATGACSSVPGNFNGYGSDPMSMVVVHKNPDYGPMTSKQYHVAVVHAQSCHQDTKNQMASALEVAVTNGAADAASGYVGESLGYKNEAAILGSHLAKKAIPAVGAFAATYNGIAGAANGVKIKSATVANYVGNCTNGDIHDPITAQGMGGMHVYGSTIRTSNSSSHMPSWAKRANGTSTQTPPASMNNASSNEPQNMSDQPQ